MAKSQPEEKTRVPKPVIWLHGEIKTPPFTNEGRQEAGVLLRLLQNGERLKMPQAEQLPKVGPGCGALRIRDAEHNWRIMYRVDADAVLIGEVYSKKSRAIPDDVIERCQKRFRQYDEAAKRAKQQSGKRG